MHHSGPKAMSGSVFASDAGASMHAHASPGMLSAHLVAAVLTIAMIYWSEALPAKIGSFPLSCPHQRTTRGSFLTPPSLTSASAEIRWRALA